MQFDIRAMKRKVDSISINIKIYKRDIKKNLQKLEEKYNISDKEIDSKIIELENQRTNLINKEQLFLEKANRILERSKQ